MKSLNKNLLTIDAAKANDSPPQVPEAHLMFLEEFTPEMEKKFHKQIMHPYYKSVFADLALRSSPPPKEAKVQKSVDKVTFVEYVKLPGILADRFFSLATLGSTEQRIHEDTFVHLLSHVFSSSLDKKQELAFSM